MCITKAKLWIHFKELRTKLLLTTFWYISWKKRKKNGFLKSDKNIKICILESRIDIRQQSQCQGWLITTTCIITKHMLDRAQLYNNYQRLHGLTQTCWNEHPVKQRHGYDEHRVTLIYNQSLTTWTVILTAVALTLCIDDDHNDSRLKSHTHTHSRGGCGFVLIDRWICQSSLSYNNHRSITTQTSRATPTGNESVPIQLAQCWFPGLAISNAQC